MKFSACSFAVILATFVVSSAATAPGFANANNSNHQKLQLLRRLQDEDECDGMRAQECGATNTDRAEFCCEGYVCAGSASVRCVKEGDADADADADGDETPTANDATDATDDMSDAEPAPAPEPDEEPPMVEPKPEEPQNCAAKGERSQQCGATNTDRPEFCCSGLICSDGAGVSCLEDPALAQSGTGNGLYQTERYSLGGIEVEGTSFESEVNGDTIRINLPEGSTAKAFVMMFMGDSGGAETGERVAYHDNWVHLLDEGEGQSEDLNCKVQHKVWAGNNGSFRVWDGVNKFVIMPSFLGVDEANPIVEAKSWRFTDVEQVYAPSVNTVDGGVVVVMYLLDSASNDDVIIQGVIGGDDYRVLSSDLTQSGESMAAFAAATDGSCTGPIAATSTGEFASGIAMTISLRPLGMPVEDLQDCSVAEDELDATESSSTEAPTSSPTARVTATAGEPTVMPTSAPTLPPAWFEPTPEPTAEDDTAMPSHKPTPFGTVIPPTDPPSAASAFTSNAFVYGSVAIMSLYVTYML